ncbi:17028_t:CDS:2, partial [Funneliformis geosporum]
MVNENLIPKTETVCEIKNEIPSFEEFMKNYKVNENLNYADLRGGSVGEVKGYGPCRNSTDENGGPSTKRGGNAGIGGAIASGGAGYSMLGIKDSSGEAKFLSASAGGEIGAGPGGVVAGYSLNADLASVQTGGFSANVGVDGGSGVSFGAGGVEAKVAGLGVSVGKKMGVSTPLGGISVDLEEACVVHRRGGVFCKKCAIKKEKQGVFIFVVAVAVVKYERKTQFFVRLVIEGKNDDKIVSLSKYQELEIDFQGSEGKIVGKKNENEVVLDFEKDGKKYQ